MGMRLLLVASIVSTGLVFVQPRNDVGNDPHEVRENFRNLFNSINKNDLRKTGTYRNALEVEAAREKQDFDTMKDTWRSRRQRNADEHRDIRERRAAFKREAETTAALEPSSESPETPGTCGTPPEPSEQSTTSPPDEQSTTSPSDEQSIAPSLSAELTELSIPTRRSTISYELATFIQSNVSRPSSPKPTHENCADLKTALWTYDMSSFVKKLDRVYAQLFRHPQSNQGSLDVLNHILTSCNVHTKKLETIRRQDHRKEFSNGTEAAGVVDVRTVDQKGGNLVVKIKFNRESCVALGQLLNILVLNEFNSLYPNEKISLLAMTFNKDDEGPVVREWIALYAKDGEILGKGQQYKAACLKTDEYKNMTYKEKPIVSYFDNLNLV